MFLVRQAVLDEFKARPSHLAVHVDRSLTLCLSLLHSQRASGTGVLLGAGHGDAAIPITWVLHVCGNFQVD